MPALKRGTEVWMHYGTAFDLKPLVGVSVWDANHLGVWHMNEADGGVAADATKNGLDAVPTGNHQEVMVSVAGKLGRARVNQTENKTATGQMNGYIVDGAAARFNDAKSFSVSGWFKANSVVDSARLFARRSAYDNLFGFEVEMSSSSTALAMRGSGYTYNLSATIPDVTADWVHLFFSFDGTSGAVYANGGKVASGTVGEAKDTSLPFAIGNNSVCNEAGFNGAVDEVRFRACAATEAWAKAEYATVADPSFLTLSASQPTVGGLIIVVR